MVTEKNGDMFAETFDVMTNPVNCKGVMGAGLAKRFGQFYPAMLEWYGKLCAEDAIKPGDMRCWRVDSKLVIYNVATKDHWKDQSQYQWVKIGLLNIRQALLKLTAAGLVYKVAIPALGCGLGGLQYKVVAGMTHDQLDDLNHTITLFTPQP
jgi:O-acetyl-ADP-ribose deacetylase (regulator of RNase III)